MMKYQLQFFVVPIIITSIITDQHTSHASISDKFHRFKILTSKHLCVRTAKELNGVSRQTYLTISIFGRTLTIKLRSGLQENTIFTSGARLEALRADGSRSEIGLDLHDFHQGVMLRHPGSRVHSVKHERVWFIHARHPNDPRLSFSIEPLSLHINITNKKHQKDKMIAFRHKDVEIFNDKTELPHYHPHLRKETDLNKNHRKNKKPFIPKQQFSVYYRPSLKNLLKNEEIRTNFENNTGNENELSKFPLNPRKLNFDLATLKHLTKTAKNEENNHVVKNIAIVRKQQEKMIRKPEIKYKGLRKKRDSNPYGVGCDILSIADYTFFSGVGQQSAVRTAKILVFVFQITGNIFWSTDFKDSGYDKRVGIKIRGMDIFTDRKLDADIINHLRGAQSKKDKVKSLYFRRYCLVHLSSQRFQSKFVSDNFTTDYADQSQDSLNVNICGGFSGRSTNVGRSSVSLDDIIMPLSIYSLVVAHELGHNFGATHDNPQDQECSPSQVDGGKYLMWSTVSRGFSPNNDKFSPCSRRSMAKALKARKSCLMPIESFESNRCGNGIVESGEDCDEGLSYRQQNTRCCTQGCSFAPNAKCSPYNHPCCNASCSTAPKGSACFHKFESSCFRPGVCDGSSQNTCLSEGLQPDGHPCGFGESCQKGVCMPFCRQLGSQMDPPRSLIPCECDRNEKEMCSVCCKQLNGSKKSGCHPFNVSYPDGTPCQLGHCNDGVCRKSKQHIGDVKFKGEDLIPQSGVTLAILTLSIITMLTVLTIYVIIASICVRSDTESRN